MKKLFTVVSLLLVVYGFGQTNLTSKIGLYKWTESVFIKPCEINGTDSKINAGSAENPVMIPMSAIATKVGQKFRILNIIDESTAIIQVLDYTNNEKEGNKLYNPTTDFFKYNFKGTVKDYVSLPDEAANSRNYGNKQAYFKVAINYIDELSIKETKVGGALAAGIINFPFKYRPQKSNADFSGAFNFGAGIGYKFPHKIWRQFTYSVISGYSISNIVLDSSNSNKNQGELSSTNNFTAFSFSLGFLAEYQKVQAGIFLGWDRIGKLNQREFEWQYQGRPWISVGFGLAIFSGQKEQAEKNPSATQDGK